MSLCPGLTSRLATDTSSGVAHDLHDLIVVMHGDPGIDRHPIDDRGERAAADHQPVGDEMARTWRRA